MKCTSYLYDIKIKVMKTFDNLDFEKLSPFLNGVQARVQFDNGFGASVVKSALSYGGKDGLYELAVLDKDGKLTYDTPVTSDVEGYLTPEDVTKLLIQIQEL